MIRLLEHPEHLVQHVDGNPRSVVADPDHDRAVLPLRVQVDVSSRRRELGRVVEHVREHLGEPGTVSEKGHRLGRQGDRQLMSLSFDGAAAQFHRIANDLRELHRLLAQHDLSSRDPRDVEKVLDESDQLLQLPVHHLVNMSRVLDPLIPEQIEPVSDRAQRIPELVREHGQEVVLHAVRAPELLLNRFQREGLLPQPLGLLPELNLRGFSNVREPDGDSQDQPEGHGAFQEREIQVDRVDRLDEQEVARQERQDGRHERGSEAAVPGAHQDREHQERHGDVLQGAQGPREKDRHRYGDEGKGVSFESEQSGQVHVSFSNPKMVSISPAAVKISVDRPGVQERAFRHRGKEVVQCTNVAYRLYCTAEVAVASGI